MSKLFKRHDPKERIAALVKAWRPDRDGGNTRYDSQYATTDPAFTRDPDAEGKFTRRIVEAAGKHQRVDPARAQRADDRMAGFLMPAAIGKEEPGRRELAACHRNRAVMDINAQHLFRRVDQIAVGTHVMRKRQVPVGNGALGLDHFMIDNDGVVVRQKADETHDMADGFARLVAGKEHVGNGQRTSIDEGIARDALFIFQLDDRVEGIAGRFASYPAPDRIARLPKRER